MSNQLGKTIRILRHAKGMKVSDVARGSGVSVPYVSLLESGARQPSLDVITRIAATLEVPSEALAVIGMGSDTLVSSDKRVAKLTETVGRLMEMENKLSQFLAKESRSATKGRSAGARRKGDGGKRR